MGVESHTGNQETILEFQRGEEMTSGDMAQSMVRGANSKVLEKSFSSGGDEASSLYSL